VKQSHKTLVLWVMLILMFVSIYHLVAEEQQPKTVDYSDFMGDVRADRVEKVEIRTRDKTSEFHYWRVGSKGEREQKVSVGVAGEQTTRELLDHNVKVAYKADDQNGAGMNFNSARTFFRR
jgi:cell division protease FtsH